MTKRKYKPKSNIAFDPNGNETLERLKRVYDQDKASINHLELYFSACRNYINRFPNDVDTLIKHTSIIKKMASEFMNNQSLPTLERKDALNWLRKTWLLEARYHFESYMIYMEMDRQPEKRFYLPRRKTMRVLANDYQDLHDGKIDFLGISLPPRVGKSTMGIFFITWLMGKYPELSNVMSGHSDPLTKGFYQECLSLIKDDVTYKWSEVFPNMNVITSAKSEQIDVGNNITMLDRFPSLTCRSVGGTLTGAVECSGCLYTDDLVEDLEESLNPERLEKKYQAYLNQLKDRMQDGAFQVMVGTRWNVYDPLGRVKEQYEGNDRYRFRVIPALDENDNSNFEYDYGLGFSTEYYLDQRESIGDATFMAKYQGEPYERDGLLVEEDELSYYNGELFDKEPDNIVCVNDVAWGGGDDFVSIVAFIYGDDVYIHDVICDNRTKDITKPRVVSFLKLYKPYEIEFESNNGGDEYADDINRILREEHNLRLNITKRKSSNKISKVNKIIANQPEIANFIYRDKSSRNKEYEKFMSKLLRYTIRGKNKHDDVPDALSMLAIKLKKHYNRVEVFKRRF